MASLPLPHHAARRPIVSLAGYILGFARALGEFGATLMVAGNIPGHTQTIPTAIYVAVDSGGMAAAWSWAAVMVGMSFIMLMFANRYSKS